jgi:hypothetical protein
MDGSTDGDRIQGRQPGRSFDPRPHLRRIQARGQEADYLDIKWRLAWLRAERPDARITTDLVTLRDTIAIFRAVVDLPGGGSATGYGSETRMDFPDFVEKAETKAIGRALAVLGYGTQFALELDLERAEAGEGDGPDASEPAGRPRGGASLRLAPSPEPDPEPEPVQQQETEPEQAPGKDADTGTREPQPQAEEFSPADVSWNDFWYWARGLGYSSKSQLEGVLGQPLADMTPREVRAKLIAFRRDQGLPV